MGQGIHKVPAHLLSPPSLPPKLHSLALNLIRVDHLTFDGGSDVVRAQFFKPFHALRNFFSRDDCVCMISFLHVIWFFFRLMWVNFVLDAVVCMQFFWHKCTYRILFFSKSSTPPSELEWSTPKYTFFLFQVNEHKQVRQTLHNNNGEREIECLNETNYVNIINISKNNSS